MRKITAIVLSVLMVFSSFGITIFADGNVDYTFSEEEESALSLLGQLSVTDIKTARPIYRGEFLRICSRLVGMENVQGYSGNFPFADVTPDMDFYSVLGYFTSLGIISNAENFYPQREISETEAVKILVSVLGYDDHARAFGGYPTGYMACANNINLFTKFNGDGKLSTGEMANLVYTALHSEIRHIIIGEGRDVRSGATPLSEYHRLRTVEQRINSTERTGLTSPTDISPEGYIRLGDEIYNISYVPELKNYPGYKIRAYISTDSLDKRIYGYEVLKSKELTFDASEVDFSISDFKISTDKKDYSVSRDYQIIYNGVAIDSSIESELPFSDGKIIMTDTDSDGVFDLLNIWKNEYVVVDTFTFDGAVVTDVNKTGYGATDEKLLCFNDDETMYEFCLPDGTPCTMSELLEMPALSVNISRGREFIRVTGIDKSIKGNVTGISEREVEIDGILYEKSDYARNLTWSHLSGEVTLLLTENGKAISFTDKTDMMKYGYIMQIKRAIGMDSDRIYMLCENGEKKVFTLKSNLSIDEEPVSRQLALSDGIIHNYQFIRYMANGENVINIIDTESDENLDADNLDVTNNLRIYHKEKDMRWYKSAHMIKQLYAPKKSVVFCVPFVLYDDPAGASYTFNEADFYVSSISSLDTFTYIDASVYDVSDERDPGAIVRYSNDNPETALGVLGEYSGTGAIEKVTMALDSEGNSVRYVTVVNTEGFKKFYFSRFLNDLYDSERRTLNVGDVVRYTVSGNTATNMRVEYDSKQGKPITGLSSPDVYCAENPGAYGAASNLYYHDGKVYSFTDTHIVIKDDYDGVIRVVYYNSPLVMRYDKHMESFRPIDRESIRTICSVGEEKADRVVCMARQTESTYFIALYEQ